LLDRELSDERGMLLGVDSANVQTLALLARHMREQALHSSGRPGGRLRKEHQGGKRGV
jgi:hypothetical protein